MSKKLSLLVCASWVLSMCTVGHPTELRLMGMGDIGLVVEDESNMINLYDFGGNVAALYMDEPMSTAKAGFNYVSLTESDSTGDLAKLTQIGGRPPERMTDYVPLRYRWVLPEGIPLGAEMTYRTEEVAVRVAADLAHASLADEGEEPDTSVTFNTLPNGVVQYSTLLGDQWALGLQVGYLRATESWDPDVLAKNTNSFSAGAGLALTVSEFVTVGGTIDYFKPTLETDTDSTAADLTGNGYDVGLQGVFRAFGLVNAGARIEYGSFSGDATGFMDDTLYETGSANSSHLSVEAKALTEFFLIPVQMGLTIGYSSQDGDVELEEGATFLGIAMEDEFERFRGGISTLPLGVGLIYSTHAVTLGGEFHYALGSVSDEATGESMGMSTIGFKVGTEVSMGIAEFRGGFVYSKSSPNEDEWFDPTTTTNFTLGAGVIPLGTPVKAEFAYNHITHSLDDGIGSEIATDLIAVGVKMYF